MQRVRVQDIVSQEGEDEARTCPRARAEAEEVRQARKAALVTAAERKMRSGRDWLSSVTNRWNIASTTECPRCLKKRVRIK